MTTYKTTILGTVPYVDYQFRIKGTNQQGEGPWSMMTLGDQFNAPPEESTPVMTHSAKGAFTVTNFDGDAYDYHADIVEGSGDANVNMDTGVVTMTAENAAMQVHNTFTGVANLEGIRRSSQICERKKITYTSVNEPIWHPCTPPAPYPICCVACDGSDNHCCWGGSPCSGGLCCHSCSGGHWEDNWVQKENPPPAGYTKQHGEWYRIYDPARNVVLTPEPISQVSASANWNDDYYVTFEGVEPGDELLISLIFFDGDEPYQFYSFPTDTDQFRFVKSDGKTQLQIRKLEDLRPGTRYELVAYSDEQNTDFLTLEEQEDTSEIYREEGYVI